MMKPASAGQVKLLDNYGLKQSPTLSMWKQSLIIGKKMAAISKHEHILRTLNHGDVSSNELFYHNRCLTKYTNQYNSFLSRKNIDSTDDTWLKELALNKMVLYIRDK